MSTDIKPSEQEIAISRVYAQALLSLAEEQGETEVVLEQLDGIVQELNRDEGFAAFLTSPLVDTGDRQTSLERMFRTRLSDLLLDTFLVMNRKGRMGLVPAIAETFRQELERLRGQVRAHVKTAVSLEDTQRGQIVELVSKLTGKTATLVESVDASLIGGIVLRVGDNRFDRTLSKELNKLQTSLLDRAAQELHTGKFYISEESQ